MARYYGEVTGAGATTASKTGTANTGMNAHVRGWDIGAEVRLYTDSDGKDRVTVEITRGSNGRGAGRFVGTFRLKGEKIVKVGK